MTNITTKPQSARIIPLPGAATEPVIQQNRAGRRSKKIVNLLCFKRDKGVARYRVELKIKEIEKCRKSVDMAERILNSFKDQLIQAQQQPDGAIMINAQTPSRPAVCTRVKTGLKVSEAIPAYGVGDGVLTFRHGLEPRERGVIDRALAIVGRCLRVTQCGLPTPDAVKTYLQLHLAGEQHERFAVLFLDVQNRLLAFETMSVGTLTQTSVYPREIVRAALAHGASAVVLAHNHPSGTVEPSQADLLLTQTLKTTLALIDVRVIDHVIVAPWAAVSMAERGLL